jgi:integrase
VETLENKGKPNRVALTLAKARDAKLPAKGDYILWDATTRGFGLRVYSTGAKIWVAQKKLEKRPIRVHLGRFPDMPLNKAREEAEDALAKIRKGGDPNLEKRQQARETERARDREKLTIGFVFMEYLAQAQGAKPEGCQGDAGGGEAEGVPNERADTKKKAVPIPTKSANTILDIEKAKRRLESGELWKLPIEAVDAKALHKEYLRLCRLADDKRNSNGGRTAAGGILRYVRAAFNLAAQAYKLKLDNPFVGLNTLEQGWQTAPARTGIVAYADGDLARWWGAVESLRNKTDARARDAATISDWLQVALLLGGRKTESLSLKWEDLNLDRGFGVFPHTKNGREHHFPLAPYVRSIFERRKKANQDSPQPSEYVFRASRVGWKSKTRTHIKEPKMALREVKKVSGIGFSAHDLRRTFGTLLNELDVGDITVRKALNHAPGDVASRHYIQTRLKYLLPIYQRLETLVLTEAGVIKPEDRPVEVVASQAEWDEFQRWKKGGAEAQNS